MSWYKGKVRFIFLVLYETILRHDIQPHCPKLQDGSRGSRSQLFCGMSEQYHILPSLSSTTSPSEYVSLGSHGPKSGAWQYKNPSLVVVVPCTLVTKAPYKL